MSSTDRGPRSAPSFSVEHDAAPSDVLVAGFASPGLAGLTAVDYLIDQFDLEQTGHVAVEQLPAITPFENGTPHHHTRFFTGDDFGATLLAGELFIPPLAAAPFGTAVHEWVAEHDVSEVNVLAGVPVPHGPDEHRTFYVATEDYRDARLADVDVDPMGRGFLDGVNADLLSHGIDESLSVSVYVTPVHAQVPDVEAAVRLVETIDDVYGFGVDTDPLAQFADDVEQYYRDLSERIQSADDPVSEDRMYM